MKRLAILGSTGSIGRQTLEVVEAHPSLFSIEVLAINSNIDLLMEQAARFHPKHIFVTNRVAYETLQGNLVDENIQIHNNWTEFSSICDELDFVIGAISGAAGIEPTLMALEKGLTIGLANKETLVSAGDLVADRLARFNGKIIPVDSEHSAIFQCLDGQVEPEKLILTASGGPFRTWDSTRFPKITLADALAHPNWHMGSKITIDSATLMNKGLEVIEAQRLFKVPLSAIDVVVHPESIIHSMVQFPDGSILAQLGLADMRLPIQYALSYPERLPNPFPKLDLIQASALHFEAPRWNDFPALKLAYEAARIGGSMPAVMNAANEVAVAAFLAQQISFVDIIPVVSAVLNDFSAETIDSLEMLREIDQKARLATKIKLESVGSML